MTNVILTSSTLYKLLELFKKETDYYSSKPRFRKIEKIDDAIYAITLHTKKGKYNILIDIKKKLFTFGKLKIENSYNDNLTTYLNRKIKNRKITSIHQHNLDRIIIFEINSEDEIRIFFELFGAGNLIITDQNYRIVNAYKEFETKKRSIKKGGIYVLPQDRIQILMETAKQGKSISRKDLFRYALIDPQTLNYLINSDKKEFDVKEIIYIYELAKELIEKSLQDPCIYLQKDGEKLYIHPYILQRDVVYGRICGINKITKFLKVNITSIEDEYIQIISRMKTQLKERIEEMIKEKEKTIENLNEMYTFINDLENAFEGLRRGEDVEKIGMYEVVGIDRKNKYLELEKDGSIVKLRYDINPYSSISLSYDKVKSYEEAIRNLEKEIEELEKRIEEEKKKRLVEKVLCKKTLSKKWFEKFIWSISTNGFLIVAGKDATTNEILIKKHLEDTDIVLHAEITGSPFTLLKNGDRANADDIYDAALITAAYSKAWKIGVSSIPVYYVKPEQISKKTPSGEYIKKGSFMIYGKKSYLKGIQLELFICVFNDEEMRKILIGSKNCILKHSVNNQKKFFRLTQGRASKSQVVDKIISEYMGQGLLDDDLREHYKYDLMNRLPTGKYRVELIDRKILQKS